MEVNKYVCMYNMYVYMYFMYVSMYGCMSELLSEYVGIWWWYSIMILVLPVFIFLNFCSIWGGIAAILVK